MLGLYVFALKQSIGTFVLYVDFAHKNNATVVKTVAVAGATDLSIQVVRTILAIPPFSAVACASAALASSMMRSIGMVSLPSRTASA